MAYLGEFYREILSLVLCATYLSFISCADVNKDLQKFGYDDDYDPWWRKYFTTTEEPDFWWKRFTSDPLDERDTHPYKSLSTGFIIYLVAFFLIILVFGCGLIYCMKYMDFNSGASSSNRRRLTIPSSIRNVDTPSENTRTIEFQVPSPVESASPFFSIFTISTDNSSNLSNATDRPPGYDDVALSDLSAQKAKYPEVRPREFDSPPPKYEENTVLKY